MSRMKERIKYIQDTKPKPQSIWDENRNVMQQKKEKNTENEFQFH